MKQFCFRVVSVLFQFSFQRLEHAEMVVLGLGLGLGRQVLGFCKNALRI